MLPRATTLQVKIYLPYHTAAVSSNDEANHFLKPGGHDIHLTFHRWHTRRSYKAELCIAGIRVHHEVANVALVFEESALVHLTDCRRCQVQVLPHAVLGNIARGEVRHSPGRAEGKRNKIFLNHCELCRGKPTKVDSTTTIPDRSVGRGFASFVLKPCTRIQNAARIQPFTTGVALFWKS